VLFFQTDNTPEPVSGGVPHWTQLEERTIKVLITTHCDCMPLTWICALKSNTISHFGRQKLSIPFQSIFKYLVRNGVCRKLLFEESGGTSGSECSQRSPACTQLDMMLSGKKSSSSSTPGPPPGFVQQISSQLNADWDRVGAELWLGYMGLDVQPKGG